MTHRDEILNVVQEIGCFKYIKRKHRRSTPFSLVKDVYLLEGTDIILVYDPHLVRYKNTWGTTVWLEGCRWYRIKKNHLGIITEAVEIDSMDILDNNIPDEILFNLELIQEIDRFVP